MEQSIISLNQTILENYQKLYPNLINFSYSESEDSLIFNNQKAKLNGYGLSRIDPVFFSLLPQDIFLYFQKGFYYNINESKQINSFFNQVIITDDEINYIKKYVENYCDRCEIYARNSEIINNLAKSNENVKFFINELLEGKKIIDSAKINSEIENNTASCILYDFYQQVLEQRQNGEETNLNNGMKLTRQKNNIPYSEFNESEFIETNQTFGIAGFTSTILIISASITFGMYLALKFLP